MKIQKRIYGGRFWSNFEISKGPKSTKKEALLVPPCISIFIFILYSINTFLDFTAAKNKIIFFMFSKTFLQKNAK